MIRLTWLPGVITFVCLNAFSLPATAAEMTIQFTNDTERALNLKLFSQRRASPVGRFASKPQVTWP